MNNQFSKIHPELRRAAQRTPRFHFSRKNLWLINLFVRLMPSRKSIPGIHVENRHIPGPDGRTRLRLRVYKPQTMSAPGPVLLWLHGGGYVIGKPEQDDERCAHYVRELGIVVVSVDYRCAPQHLFPAGLEDSYAALHWAAFHAQELGGDAQRIAIGGASAGGGLAAALAQLALDRGGITPVFQLLVYPMLDDRTALRGEIDDSQNVTWTQQSNRFGWESYLGRGCGADDLPAYAAPARRSDLSGLPPAWIGVGDLDIFHEEDVAYGQRLRACGVGCTVDIIPGAFHGFDVFDPRIPIVQEFRKMQIAALRKYLFP